MNANDSLMKYDPSVGTGGFVAIAFKAGMYYTPASVIECLGGPVQKQTCELIGNPPFDAAGVTE